MPDREPVLKTAQAIVLRLYDVAYEIDLRLAERRGSERSSGGMARAQLLGTPTKAVSFGVPPLMLDLGPVSADVDGAPVVAAASARIYDFGIAAFALRFPLINLPWSEFSRRVNVINDAVGPGGMAAPWDGLLRQCCERLGDALRRPSATPLQEDYLIALAEEFAEPITAEELLARVDLVSLLSGKERALSEGARADLLRQRFSYYPDDLAVMTWDRAFLYEPQRDTDVADVLEIANAQLLEIRAYDELLDSELPRMRARVDAVRGRMSFLASRDYARLARRLYTVVSEVTELAERVDNALQVTEDVYLARLYAAAMTLFRVPNVSAAVDRKLAIIRDTYSALHQEAAGARAELLEIAILGLIALEIVLSFLK